MNIILLHLTRLLWRLRQMWWGQPEWWQLPPSAQEQNIKAHKHVLVLFQVSTSTRS